MQLVKFRNYALGAVAGLSLLALFTPGIGNRSYADTPTPAPAYTEGPQYPFVTPTPTPKIEWLVATPITPRETPASLPDTGGSREDYNTIPLYAILAGSGLAIFGASRLLDSYRSHEN